MGPTLDYPDLIHFRAAEGWVELGNFKEALLELDRIAGRGRAHRSVLNLRWRVLASTNDWEGCLMVAQMVAKTYPSEPHSWVLLAETFYLTGNVQKAYRIGLSQAARFPHAWRLLYDTACYACLVGQFAEAEKLFRAALRARAIRRRSQRARIRRKGAWLTLGPSSRAGSADGGLMEL